MHTHTRHRFILACTIVLAGFMDGCTTVVTPLSTSDIASSDERHGLVIGNMQLAWHAPNDAKKRTRPLDMKWLLEETTQGKRITIAELPTAGPFVVKLPAGSYRVNGINFEGLWGTWHTMLPTTFQVQPEGCTSLGTRDLQRETDSLTDWITGHVFQQLEPTHVELREILATKDCSTLTQSSVKARLGFYERTGERQF